MAHDSEKRFHSIMDKLFHAAKPVPHSSSSQGVQQSRHRKRPGQSTALSSMQSNGREGATAHQQHPSSLVQAPLCRPWDRGDFVRRLATFKSMSWFAKPKVVSAVNCARKGWINVDMDTIACEACGARMLFSTPTSWALQQEKAALVFSLKLDSGHKLLCPWIDNFCDETLAQFPATPSSVLVDNFRYRCSALLKISGLPQISSSIDYMQSPMLEEFLNQHAMPECGNISDNNSQTETLCSEHEIESAKLYYQAQKIISLCGWSPCSLPYLVDCKDGLNHSDGKTVPYSSHILLDGSSEISVHSGTSNSSNSSDNSMESDTLQADPRSVVFDCSLCGATVGLWAFSIIPRPVEIFRLVGHTEIGGENGPSKDDGIENKKGSANVGSADTILSKKSSLNLTIAGGPPPTKQNFKATISLPVIGHNLRARICNAYIEDAISFHDKDTRSDVQQNSVIDETHGSSNNSTVDIDTVLAQEAEVSGQGTSAEAVGHDLEKGNLVDNTRNLSHTYARMAAQPMQALVVELAESTVPGKDMKKTLPDKAMEFNPIRQHRHFCPWIASINNLEPGWKQLLSALNHERNSSNTSPTKSPSSSIIKVNDPVGSVRKLFTSPPSKRMKLPRSSSETTGTS